MAPNIPRPSETSPLLPKPRDNSPPPIDPGSGIAPEGPDARVNGGQDEEDIERQASDGDSTKHQGLPEVRKRLKYIFPAIAIGVSRTLCALLRHMNAL